MKCFKLLYRLLEHDVNHPGKMVDFNPCKVLNDAYIIADSAAEAYVKLKQMFNMLTVEIVAQPSLHIISEQEYNDAQ